MHSNVSNLKAIAFSAILILALTSCSPKTQSTHYYEPTNYNDQLGLRVMAPVQSIAVTDANGAALAGAKILIGERAGVPFATNVLFTDATGLVSVPAEWTNAQPLTVEASGYVTSTWLAQQPVAPGPVLALKLRKTPLNNRLELRGKVTGFQALQKDGWADVGVVFPALRRNQLASLQVSDLISPETDQLTFFGQTVDIPSNISIPKQEEKYYFTLTLDKPLYRTYLNESRNWKMVATHARFPFGTVVDDLRAGKSFFEVLNYFEFKSASLVDVPVGVPSTSQDIGMSDIPFVPSLDVTAPRFASGLTMLAVSVADAQGMLFPADVKKLNSGETRRLVAPKAATGFVVGALRPDNATATGPAADSLSAVIAPNNATTRFEVFDIPLAPKAVGSTLILSPPRLTLTLVTPSVTYATLNQITLVTSGRMRIEKKTPAWDIYANGWAPSFNLPEISPPPKGQYRWEVLFGGTANGAPVRLGPNMVEDLSHVTKSAVDL